MFAEHAAALADLCRRHGVQRLELFGSAATGQDDPARSDLDFLVEFEPIPDGRYADAYFGVLEGLEAMFRRPVDLVVDSAIRNRYFRESVDRTKTLLYASSSPVGRSPTISRRPCCGRRSSGRCPGSC